MDIEATMQFILESQARSEARLDKALARADKHEARANRADARMDRAEARMDKHEAYVKAVEKRLDKRMDAITKLVQQGMRMMVELRESQKDTDRELKALIKSLRNGRNGRNGH